MAAEIDGVFKPKLKELVLASKILVVGAGGIGCEVLKNLVMCGFKDIEIVSIFFALLNYKNKICLLLFRLIWTRLMSQT
jgi:tRNA A37 threonylcarbamoyladenosine dehydratase